MTKLDHIIIHCSDSTFGDAATIDQWHKERGFQAPDGKHIGYHFIVLNGCRKLNSYNAHDNGLIEPGRTLDNDLWVEQNEVGAHALGFNSRSIGVCLIGGANGTKSAFTIPQYYSALIICAYYELMIPDLVILGHNETGANKPCPVISMDLFRERLNNFSTYSSTYWAEDIKNRGV